MSNNIEDKKIKEDLVNIINEISKVAEKEGYDDYWFYSQLLDGDYVLKSFFEEYFRKNEGFACCCDKANYVLKGIKKMIEIKHNVKLQQTYREYQENGVDIGRITELDKIAYWCPTTIKTTKEAIELFYKETFQKWRM